MSTSYERIYAVVKRIPRGRVATYGQVADLAGLHGHARQVGYALHATPAHVRIPWQRVVNSKGEISLRPHEGEATSRRRSSRRKGSSSAPLDGSTWTATSGSLVGSGSIGRNPSLPLSMTSRVPRRDASVIYATSDSPSNSWSSSSSQAEHRFRPLCLLR